MDLTDFQKSPKYVRVYTDGACLGNPGPGGWCAILTYGDIEKEITGGEANTTNNRMELTAIIEALKALKESCRVEIFCDSKYVVEAFNKNWIYEWERKAWRKADKKPVKNQDLWEQLLCIVRNHEVTFHHVHGHTGHEYNERCDSIAQKSARAFSKVIDP